MTRFPEWAPPSLVEQLERSKSTDRKYPVRNPDQIVADTLLDERFTNMSEAAIENFRESIYRSSLFLPHEEELDLLERVLTDLRMKPVWEALGRREKESGDYRHFWSACTGAILGWRGEPKNSAKEHRELYEKIYNLVAELQGLLGRSRGFHHYSITRLIDEPTVEWMVDMLDAKAITDEHKNIEYARFCLSDVVPSIDRVLEDIAHKAKELADTRPVVLKPRSENAATHYFVRSLSRFLRDYYGQPLHEVVSATASVLLNENEIDAVLVRKLVTLQKQMPSSDPEV